MSAPCSNPCQVIACTPPSDLDYNLQRLEPTPLPPVPPPPDQDYFNQAVYWACPSGSLYYTGVLPSWISIDVEHARFVGAAGTYTGATQGAANSEAQTALDDFAEAALADGSLVCSAFPPTVTSIVYGATDPFQSTVDTTANKFWTSWGYPGTANFVSVFNCTTGALESSIPPPAIVYGIQHVPSETSAYGTNLIYATSSQGVNATLDTFAPTTPFTQTRSVFTIATTSAIPGVQLWIPEKRKLFFQAQQEAIAPQRLNLGVLDFDSGTKTEWMSVASGAGPGAVLSLSNFWYNPTQNHVFLGISATGLYLVNADTLTPITQIAPPAGALWGTGSQSSGRYCADNDRIYVPWTKSVTEQGFSIIKATDNTIETNVTFPYTLNRIMDMVYRENTGQMYFFDLDGFCHVVDITKYAIVPSTDMIVGRFSIGGYTNKGTSVYNPNNGRVYISCVSSIKVIS